MPLLKNQNLLRNLCYINGKWISSNSKKTFSVLNPFDQSLIADVPDCSREETKVAIEAATKAFPKWSSETALTRSEYLSKWAKLIDENQEDLATLMTLEQGKPITESRGEITYANSFIKWFANEALRVYGDTIPSAKSNQHFIVIKQPVGVVGAITPWNFPAAMITRKCAAALAVGCTIVIKAAEDTPLSAFALAALSQEAGIPPGVFNVITGNPEEIGAELTSNPLVRKISFTGSTRVGKLLMEQSASTLKKLSLELGGNAPFIVFDDADLDSAVLGTIASKFRNTGQTCVCANRILVHDKIYDSYTQKLLAAVKKLRLGNGLDEKVQQGPLINDKAMQKVEKHVADAIAKGGKVLCGGKRSPVGNLFYEPTVIADANSSMLLANEETFGPIAPLFKFNSEEEAIQLANATEFGLAGYFYSENIHRVWRVASALETGMVGINAGIISSAVAPFGGVKQSGIGREGSKYGIDEYVEIKYLCME